MKEYTSCLGVLFPAGPNLLSLPMLLGMTAVLAVISLFAFRPTVFLRWRWLTLSRAFWGALCLLLVSTLLGGRICSIVVFAGDADARVQFDGHAVALHCGDVARFTVVWHLGRTDQTFAFSSVSDSGVTVSRNLEPNLYIAELSGRGVVWWRQIPYDATYLTLADARLSGEVRGATAYVSHNLSDRMFREGVEAPKRIEIHKDGKAWERFYRCGYSR